MNRLLLLHFWRGRRGNDSHRPSAGRNPSFSQQKFRNVDFWKRGHHEFLRLKNLHFPLIPTPFSSNAWERVPLSKFEITHRTPCARPWIRNEEVLPLMAIEKWRSQGLGSPRNRSAVRVGHFRTLEFVLFCDKGLTPQMGFLCSFGCQNGISFRLNRVATLCIGSSGCLEPFDAPACGNQWKNYPQKSADQSKQRPSKILAKQATSLLLPEPCSFQRLSPLHRWNWQTPWHRWQ